MKNFIFTIIITVLISTNLKAQSFDDIFNFSHNRFLEVGNKNLGSNIKSNKMTLSKIYLVGPPIDLGKLKIIYNVEYKWYQNDFTTWNNQQPIFAKNLHDIRLITIFNYKISKKWAFNYVNFSTIKSDFNSFNFSNAYKGINAFTIGFYPTGENNFRFGVGVTRSEEMGVLMILPVAFFYYKTDSWLIDLMYPRLNVFYKLSKKTETGFIVNYDIGAFDVEFEEGAISDMEVKPEYQTTTNLTFTPQLNYYITTHFNIYARAGINLISKHGLTDGNFHEIEKIGYESKSMVPTFGVGLTYKIPYD